MPCDEGGRDWSAAAVSQGLSANHETWERGKTRFLSCGFQREHDCINILISEFWSPAPWESRFLLFFPTPVCDNLLQPWQETNTALNIDTDIDRASQVTLVVKNLPADSRDIRDLGLISGWGRSPGERNGYPLQYSCLENVMDRGAWWATVHRVVKSRTQLKQLSTHAAAAAAKSLQSCPTLFHPIDGSPPGSPIPGILQARTLEWVAFPSSMHENEKWKWGHWVVSNSPLPHGLQPTRLLRPWDFPGKSTEVGCHWGTSHPQTGFFNIYWFMGGKYWVDCL